MNFSFIFHSFVQLSKFIFAFIDFFTLLQSSQVDLLTAVERIKELLKHEQHELREKNQMNKEKMPVECADNVFSLVLRFITVSINILLVRFFV
jgi:hypothetical protein